MVRPQGYCQQLPEVSWPQLHQSRSLRDFSPSVAFNRFWAYKLCNRMFNGQ